MKKWTTVRYLTLICALLFFFAGYSQAQESQAANMLWKISDDEGLQGYLVGSVHLVKEDIYPLNKAYQQAFEKSDIVGFEINFDSAQVKSRSLIPKLGFYPEEQSLQENISPDTYKLLQQRLDSLGLPSARFNRMEPWLVSITVPVIQLQQAGYSGQSSIDSHFYEKAVKAGKERMAFETAEFQYRLFDNLSPELQEKYLKYSLQEASENLNDFDEMMSAWKTGDAQKLDELIQGSMQEVSGVLYEKLVVERNKNWIPKMEQAMAGSKIPMFVVGAGHLVGPQSVNALLEAKGYRIEQL